MPGVTTDITRQSLPAHEGRPNLPQAPQDGPSYYDLSFLKPSVWKWEISSYFFLGGVSAGAFLLARIAERFGGRKYRQLTRTATYTSFAALLPCAPLLIKDLGDPKRFHHMLRVWKPGTPMNLGSWTLTGFGAACTAAVLREYLKSAPAAERGALAKIADGTLLLISDAAGVPLALMLAGYTGVLLSCTSNPIWCRNPWLGPMFTASAIGTGAAAASLALSAAGGRESSPDSASHKAIEAIDSAANVAEAAMLGGYLKSLGKNAKPLTTGPYARHTWFGFAGLAASEIFKNLPVRGRARKWASLAGAAVGLASGYSLRWAIVHTGKPAASDPNAARRTSLPGVEGNVKRLPR
ncbi:MAG TPA: NrfD/PsrC family molybdoenzyme membrane anchor subunit [Tepidisphaeraceae bacterium]|nr:NrfD/PsrC family molybdoenzyme membrane anchor subunit [Tepidisphaeraceae bacterium]